MSTSAGSESWTVDNLAREDLARIGWSGSPTHLRNVAHQLDRAQTGAIEYLVVRDTDGTPICKGAVDFEELEGVGTIIQVATRADLQGAGHAQRLVAEAERRVKDRGMTTARLSVEPDNERAVRLYEHLGYRATGRRIVGWEHEDESGEIGWYETTVIDMEKSL